VVFSVKIFKILDKDGVKDVLATPLVPPMAKQSYNYKCPTPPSLHGLIGTKLLVPTIQL